MIIIRRKKNMFLMSCLIGAVVISLAMFVKKSDDKISREYAITISQNVSMGRILDKNGIVIAEGIDKNREKYNKEYASAYSNLIGADILETKQDGYTVRGKCSEILYGLHQDALKNFNPLREKKGGDVQLTINSELQKYCYDLLVEKGWADAGVLVINYETGQVMAAASVPGYDLQDSTVLEKNQEGTICDKREKNKCYTCSTMYGSSIKPILYAVLLDHNMELQNYVYPCTKKNHLFGKSNTPIHCAGGVQHGALSMGRALAYSCNTYAAAAAEQIPEEQLLEGMRKFGFDEERALKNNLLFNDSRFYNKSDISENKKIMARIGGAECRGSMMGLAIAYSAIYHHGEVVFPYLIEAEEKKSGGKVIATEKAEPVRMVSAEAADAVVAMMQDAVDYGTCRVLKDVGAKVAAKSGTANYDDKSNALWMTAGIVEEGKPPVMVLTCIDHVPETVTCSEAAGTITKEVLEKILQ